MSAPDVLAMMDYLRFRAGECVDFSVEDSREADEARAAVAEAFAERDKLRNIVRSHEAQILRMTAERAAVAELVREAQAVLDHVEDEGAVRIGNQCTLCHTYRSRLRAALARVQGGEA